MNKNSSQTEQLLLDFRNELFRWNRQINLVSRQETDDRLDSLFRQCLGGGGAIQEIISRNGWNSLAKNGLTYFDLGSGGGLPGVIWHLLFSEAYGEIRSVLVEPRDKRAWFLERLARIPQMPGFEVLQGRWGEVSYDISSPETDRALDSLVVISLKALHLRDDEVLSGLFFTYSEASEVLAGQSLLIARYYPPEQGYDPELVQNLKIPSPGERLTHDGMIWESRGGGVVPLGPAGVDLASLVVSSYDSVNSS